MTDVAKNNRHITVGDTFNTGDRLLVLTVNGQPVYAEPPLHEPISEDDLRALAVRVTRDEAVAEAWLDRANLDLCNRTPREVARAGQGHLAANILRCFLAL
ncbi:hypothetical protein GCM10008955_31030 [Deinococcus malanensis]|uniref:Antitoxin Xre/MbcA/ParS-like toxin-binding domain-containing protein n=1 Tax=Deinococcus malanensis TaxID=1706855 RepID=A0ABQ2F080_9DEIO|nr:hypothetical protein [Deinococcus malanensis]GGK34881.1 hypothetical protein GCM10008955_31030 [Deinococcus malanensis]